MSGFNHDIMSLKLRKPATSSNTRTVLSLLREQGINPQSQCENGYCGYCRCKITSGEVEHSDDAIAYIGNNEILPCVATIKSDEITIEPNI